ncbi:MAG: ABC transporter permease [Acidobacteria bacterium]|nr:ABC transporter permease [Acidobacteriota bacterium]
MLTEVTRRVRRIRGPIVGAIVSLAAGVSIVAGVYSVVAGAMFDPLPYPSAERIYAVWDMGDSSGRRLVPADLVARLNSSSAGIEAAGSYATAEPSLDIGGGQSLKIKGAIVSPPLLGILGAIPIAGRTFDEADADLTAVPSVVVSERLLRDRRIPAQLEGLLVISGIPHRIIGVLPEEFAFPDREVLIWSALRLPPRSGWSGQALVRVAPFVGGGARSALDSAIRAVGAPERLAVVPLKELLLAEVRPALWLLQSAGLLLLVVAVLGGMWGFSTDAWERRSEFAMKGGSGLPSGACCGTTCRTPGLLHW